MLGGFDFGQVAIHFKKDILRDFFGQTAVAGHAPGQGKHHGLVLVDELFKVRLPERFRNHGALSSIAVGRRSLLIASTLLPRIRMSLFLKRWRHAP